jgi:hypothetical protein
MRPVYSYVFFGRKINMKRLYPVLITIMIIALSVLALTCHNFNSPIDPESANYSGTPSVDKDGDNIGQYADVDEIVLLSPANGSTVNTGIPTLTVYKFNPTKIKQYWVQIASSNSDFAGNIVYEKNDCSSNIYNMPPAQLLNYSTYYWRAKAFDGTKWSDNWSAVWSFDVSVNIPSPQNPLPKNGIWISSPTPLLDWEDISVAQAYHIQVNTNNSFTGTVIADDSALTTSLFQISSALSDNTIYYWRVRVQDMGAALSNWSSTWSFKVNRIAVIASSGSHSMMIRSDGELWGTGDNSYGELGDGTTTYRSTPVYIMSDVSAVACGLYYTMILKTACNS